VSRPFNPLSGGLGDRAAPEQTWTLCPWRSEVLVAGQRGSAKTLAYVRLSEETRERVRRLAEAVGRREFRRVAFCEVAEKAFRQYLDREERRAGAA